MSHRGSKAHKEAAWENSMRKEGRSDARAGRPARYANAAYQRGYRSGSKRIAPNHPLFRRTT